MAIKFDHKIIDSRLNIVSSGVDDNLSQVQEYARAILGLAIENDISQICCDERQLEYRLTTLDTYELAEVASKEAKSLKKIVIICNSNYLEDGKFFETVAKNRGLTIFVTSNFDQGQEWLE